MPKGEGSVKIQPSAAKWNILGTNDSSFNDGTGIGNGAISSPQKLVTGAGTSWAWQSWTPTFTNLTPGNGTLTAKYVQIGKNIFYRFSLVWGTTTSIGGSPVSFSLPVTSVSYSGTATTQPIGQGAYYDVSAGTVAQGPLVWGSTTTGQLQIYRTDSTYGFQATLTSTISATWTNPDEFLGNGFYEAA